MPGNDKVMGPDSVVFPIGLPLFPAAPAPIFNGGGSPLGNSPVSAFFSVNALA
jgi:hypothetical protein